MEAVQWTTVKEFEDITYQKFEGVARIALIGRRCVMHFGRRPLMK